MESFEKRKRERKKQELRKEKAARKLQGLESSGPAQEDYFADPDSASKTDAVEGEASAETTDTTDKKDAGSPPAAPSSSGEIGAG
jgi:hypothetical protein